MNVVLEYTRNLIPANWKTTSTGWTSGNCPMCITNGQSRQIQKVGAAFTLKKKSLDTIVLTVATVQAGVKVNN